MPFLSLRVFGFVALSVCCGGGNRTRAHPRLFASLCYARHKGVVLAYSICRFAPCIPAFSASCRLSGCHLSALSSQVPPTVSVSCSPAVSDVSAYIPCARAFSLLRFLRNRGAPLSSFLFANNPPCFSVLAKATAPCGFPQGSIPAAPSAPRQRCPKRRYY